MDIHRCRFVPYPTSAINAVAFSCSQLTGKRNPNLVRLAIGRANGDIEIWNPLGGQWHQESILHGGKDRSIDGLVWVTEPDRSLSDGRRIQGRLRLFSIGYTSTVTEWDLEKRRPKKQATGTHGDIWCLGVQPLEDSAKPTKTAKGGSSAPKTQKLVAGTIDGSLVLYSIEDGDLRFDRVLVHSTSKKTRFVSICFQKRNIVVVGCSDSSIRIYDIRSGHLLRRMTLGSDLSGGAKEIIVWCVKCLPNEDIVSGDSTGQVCIWDGKTYSQAQRLQSHKQDVLSLAVSADGSTVLSGGMDRRTALHRKTSGTSTRWATIWHRRYHGHDVKTMTSFESEQDGISVIVSGGPDANPVVTPLREAGMENHRALSHLPQAPPLMSAPRARIMASWWDREVHIWRLHKPLKDIVNETGVDADVTKNRKLLARILIKGEANITSASISNDGSLLVVSTTSDIKAFHLTAIPDPTRDELKIAKIDVPLNVAALGAERVKISPDNQWICVVQECNRVSLLRISEGVESDDMPVIAHKAVKLYRLKRDIPKHIAFGGLGQYERSVSQIAFSPDAKMLAVADVAGYIDTWVVRDPESALQNGVNGDAEDDGSSSESDSDDSGDESAGAGATPIPWTRNPNAALLPKLRNAPTLLSFSDHIPSGKTNSADEQDDYVLFAATAKPQILFLHPTIGGITPWSRRNPTNRLPVEFRNIRDLVKGALWSGDRIWMYGNTFVAMLDLSQDVAEDTPDESVALVLLQDNQLDQSKKRKRGPDTGAGNKMKRGAAGPTKVEHFTNGKSEALSLERRVTDPMDTDEQSQPGDDSDEDDSDSEPRGELALKRKAERQQQKAGQSGQGIGFWHTLKYRPIMGIVPLSGPEDEEEANGLAVTSTANGQARKTLEVALVERPLWDADTPDRYLGEGDYE
ncbi:hypothetical protein PG996_014363 [Apiospora saccharicola]|uniref:U3 small nucleolar RNA-associated protein 4 n=1 Tax=Apiospora saccharicola TaxID=335842 RepID=A0ABR1TI48_9PEZI